MPTKASHNSFKCPSEAAVVCPPVYKRRKTDLLTASYVSVATAQLAVAPDSKELLRCSANRNRAIWVHPDTSNGRGLKRSSPEAPHMSGPGMCDLWAEPPTTGASTHSTRDLTLQDPYMSDHIARSREGPTSAAPKPKRKQIALVKEEECKLRREEREGTPHISEMDDDEDMTSMSIQEMTLAGATELTISEHLRGSGSR